MRYREMLTFPIELERRSSEPLHKQITAQICSAIESGMVAQGTRIPSTRTLAEVLGVSRGVATEAYDALQAQGYLTVCRGSGTFVQPDRRGHKPDAVPAAGDGGAATATEPQIDFTPGQLSGEAFPIRAWRRAWRLASHQIPVSADPPAFGVPQLRAAIREHLILTRGLAAPGHFVVVTAGSPPGLRLILAALGAGERVAVEQPISAGLVRATGVASTRRLRVDAEGAVCSGADDVRAAVICPDGNQPLGTVMSAGRRAEALEWAKSDRYLIEVGRDVVLGSRVASLGGSPHEIVLSDFCEILTSSLRLGYALVPKEVAPKLGRLILERGEQPSSVIQQALADLLRSGAIVQQMRQLTKLYAEKRAIVDSVLAPLRLPVRHGIDGVVLISHPRAAATAARLLASGIRVQTLDSYGLTSATESGGFVIGYGHLPNAQLSRGLDRLVSQLRRDGLRGR